jgi:hypothetical protein
MTAIPQMDFEIIDDFAATDIIPFARAIVAADAGLVLEFASFGGILGGRWSALARFETVGRAWDCGQGAVGLGGVDEVGAHVGGEVVVEVPVVKRLEVVVEPGRWGRLGGGDVSGFVLLF